MFSADGISLRRNGNKLLDGVSLAIQPGQVAAIVGPNGAGKSTLLKVFSNDLKADEGEVLLNGQPLVRWSALEQAQQRAILPQSSQLTFPFKVQDVVMMGRSPFRSQRARHHTAIVERAMVLAEVQHLAQRTFTHLSGGERQRVQLARVLAQIWPEGNQTAAPGSDQPRYLLLDEPTSALDLPHQHHVLQLARRLVTEHNMGVLVVLHDLNLAAMYADQIAVLQGGRLVCAGEAQSVLTETHIRAVFGIEVDVTHHPGLDCPLIISHHTAMPDEASPLFTLPEPVNAGLGHRAKSHAIDDTSRINYANG